MNNNYIVKYDFSKSKNYHHPCFVLIERGYKTYNWKKFNNYCIIEIEGDLNNLPSCCTVINNFKFEEKF
jgi:hypothetical protein